MTEPNKFLEKIKPNTLLLIGVLTIVASHVSYSVDIIAWFSSVPFLLYLYQTKGRKSRLLLTLALFIAWTLAVAKIITEPIPFAMVFLFSLPLTLIHLPAYLIWDKFKNHEHAMFLFPAIFTIMEWTQYTFMPFASWGVGANTQSHSIVILQSLSLFGMAGLSFLIYWVNISIVEIAQTRKATLSNSYLPFGVLLIFLIYGSLRLDFGKATSKETITVATVGTDSEVSGLPFADDGINNKYKNALINRTEIAAQKGAKLISWNEAAIFIQKEDEKNWQDSLKLLANDLNISLIASYVVPISTNPLKLENKILSINSKGEVVYQYLKHQPVPGEPSIKGNEPFKTMTDNGLNIGSAICYDFDYPYIAKAFGQLNANIVAIPSSDWRGIDPLHTRMAAFRAIEQGYSLLRSTRFGLSAAINPLGEMTAQQSSFDIHDKIMLAELPTKRITTLYSIIGNSFIYACFGLLILLFTTIYKRQDKKNSR
jgi:apolipoprotein N-acyltransferase